MRRLGRGDVVWQVRLAAFAFCASFACAGQAEITRTVQVDDIVFPARHVRVHQILRDISLILRVTHLFQQPLASINPQTYLQEWTHL